ncbi:hypothetical protein J2X20_001862 [Pelomonas saccharophila]|uniref:Lipoprotein n=1 Tax=Roseateles saccharophilus TaxID=304 RepID=A0ABU1YKH5_ROSSA|nr:hypothetical protein [Roseateles saccharophilus]MDR7269233.1 hypothetical protein [Roseateles saccharophilus]
MCADIRLTIIGRHLTRGITMQACRRVRWTPIAAAVSMVAALGACTLLQPTPAVDGQGLLSTWHASAAASAASGMSVATAPCLEDDSRLDPACFAFGMGAVWDRQETRRRDMLGGAREVVNLQSAYSTLMFPIGAAAVHEKLRGAPNRALLLPAVVGSAVYGMLGAGIPERDKIYIGAAGQMQCSLVWHGQWLYRQGEVAEIDRVLKRLDERLSWFQLLRTTLVLKGKGPGAGPAGALEREKTAAASPGKDDSKAVLQKLDQQAQVARSTLQALRDLRRDIRRAVVSLSQDGDQIEALMIQALAEKRPPLTAFDPLKVGKALLDSSSKLAQLQGGEDAAPVMATLTAGDFAAGLSVLSINALGDFLAKAGAPLTVAWAEAQSLLNEQLLRTRQVVDAAEGLPCADSTLARMKKLPAKTAVPAKPASDGTTTTPLAKS